MNNKYSHLCRQNLNKKHLKRAIKVQLLQLKPLQRLHLPLDSPPAQNLLPLALMHLFLHLNPVINHQPRLRQLLLQMSLPLPQPQRQPKELHLEMLNQHHPLIPHSLLDTLLLQRLKNKTRKTSPPNLSPLEAHLVPQVHAHERMLKLLHRQRTLMHQEPYLPMLNTPMSPFSLPPLQSLQHKNLNKNLLKMLLT